MITPGILFACCFFGGAGAAFAVMLLHRHTKLSTKAQRIRILNAQLRALVASDGPRRTLAIIRVKNKLLKELEAL